MEQFIGGSVYTASDELLWSVEVARTMGKPLLAQALALGGINPRKLKDALPFAGVLLKKTEDLEKASRTNRRGW